MLTYKQTFWALTEILCVSVMTDLLWTAPEILRKKPNDAMRVNGTKPADVYSFGIIISELLTRELPYQIGMGAATLEG